MRRGIAAVLAILIVAGTAYALSDARPPSADRAFDGERAMDLVRAQVALGPRVPGSAAHAHFLTWLQAELAAAGWTSEIQAGEMLGQPVRNVVARRDQASPAFILGAHFDSRIYADKDPSPTKRGEPTPGANDGASGVAVLLELARLVDADAPSTWLVFFDAEDNGRIEGWEWILGSRLFTRSLEARPQAVIIVDMVGDADLHLPLEQNSDPALQAGIWETAASLGYADIFVKEAGQHITDDHLPFLELGIPAVDIIDIDYEYWHTSEDTPDKLSAASLEAVGETVRVWIEAQRE